MYAGTIHQSRLQGSRLLRALSAPRRPSFCFGTFVPKVLSTDFVYAWMSLSHKTRKDYSHEIGAYLVWRKPGDTVDCVCPQTGQRFFDPGNWFYACLFDHLWPRLHCEGWNEETKGDVFEGIFGYSWNLVLRDQADHISVRIADALDNYLYSAHLIWESYNWDCENLKTSSALSGYSN